MNYLHFNLKSHLIKTHFLSMKILNENSNLCILINNFEKIESNMMEFICSMINHIDN